MTNDQPFILTVRLDRATFAALDALRHEHFPPERNFLSAHITLFHALPAEHEETVRTTLHDVCSTTAPFDIAFPGLRSLGRGVAVEVRSPALAQLRAALARRWQPLLGTQDRQGYRPHVTIQNKVAPEQARQLLAQLAPAWQPLEGRGTGLLLWRYRGGPWEPAGAFPF